MQTKLLSHIILITQLIIVNMIATIILNFNMFFYLTIAIQKTLISLNTQLDLHQL